MVHSIGPSSISCGIEDVVGFWWFCEEGLFSFCEEDSLSFCEEVSAITEDSFSEELALIEDEEEELESFKKGRFTSNQRLKPLHPDREITEQKIDNSSATSIKNFFITSTRLFLYPS